MTDGGRTAIDVHLWFEFDDDGGVQPAVNVEQGAGLAELFEAFEVDSLEELKEATGGRRPNKRRIGKIALEKTSDGPIYHVTTEAERLQQVEGINERLAEGLVSDFGDIPTICKQIREVGEVIIGDALNDAQTAGYDWADDLEAFVEPLDPHNGVEKRFKEAGVWVEPENAVAGGA